VLFKGKRCLQQFPLIHFLLTAGIKSPFSKEPENDAENVNAKKAKIRFAKKTPEKSE